MNYMRRKRGIDRTRTYDPCSNDSSILCKKHFLFSGVALEPPPLASGAAKSGMPRPPAGVTPVSLPRIGIVTSLNNAHEALVCPVSTE